MCISTTDRFWPEFSGPGIAARAPYLTVNRSKEKEW